MCCKICFRTRICYKTLCETSHRTLRRYILHLNILLYLENVGLAGNHSCDMMATNESFIGDVSIFLLLN